MRDEIDPDDAGWNAASEYYEYQMEYYEGHVQYSLNSLWFLWNSESHHCRLPKRVVFLDTSFHCSIILREYSLHVVVITVLLTAYVIHFYSIHKTTSWIWSSLTVLIVTISVVWKKCHLPHLGIPTSDRISSTLLSLSMFSLFHAEFL